MYPLDRSESFQKIAEMFRSAKEVIVAAPYFGDGAMKQLGLDRAGGRVTVVCDLFSGGCNPDEIARIMKLPSKPTVKQLAGLHAKIYLCENAVVVGSANPSSNGLGFEGKELVGNVEACVFFDQLEVVAAWRDFYKNQILTPATSISANDIAKAQKLFQKRRKERTRSDVRSLLGAIRANKELLKDKPIYFTLYTRTDTSQEQDEMIAERNTAMGTSSINAYFDWPDPPEPGAFIIEFLMEEGSSCRTYNGIWRVVEKDHLVDGPGGTALFVYSEDKIDGLTVPLSDQKSIGSLLFQQMGEEGEVLIGAYELANRLKAAP